MHNYVVYVCLRGFKINTLFTLQQGLNSFANFRYCSLMPAAQERLCAGSGFGPGPRPPTPPPPPPPLGTYEGVAHNQHHVRRLSCSGPLPTSAGSWRCQRGGRDHKHAQHQHRGEQPRARPRGTGQASSPRLEMGGDRGDRGDRRLRPPSASPAELQLPSGPKGALVHRQTPLP